MDVAGFVILALVLSIFAPPTSLAAPTSAVVGGLETTLVGDRLPSLSPGQSSSSSSSTLWASTAASTVSPSPRASDSVRSCLVDGTLWQHGQQVVRSDQCEFCLCFDGELFCWWQDCPPTTARGPCQGSEAFTPCNSFTDNGLPTNDTNDEVTATVTVSSSSSSTTTVSTVSEVSTTTSSAGASESSQVSTEPPVLCKILGTVYRVGDVLPRDTGSCLQCECGSYGRIVCGPKDCLPIRDSETGTGPDAGNSLDMFDVDTF